MLFSPKLAFASWRPIPRFAVTSFEHATPSTFFRARHESLSGGPEETGPMRSLQTAVIGKAGFQRSPRYCEAVTGERIAAIAVALAIGAMLVATLYFRATIGRFGIYTERDQPTAYWFSVAALGVGFAIVVVIAIGL